MSNMKITNSGFCDPESNPQKYENTLLLEIIKKEIMAQFEKLLGEHKTQTEKTDKELREMIGELIPFNHPDYGELTRSLQEQIGNLNYVAFKNSETGRRYDNIVGCINNMYNSGDEKYTELKEGVKGNSDDISKLQGAKCDFYVKRLLPGKTFEIPVNSIIFFFSGSEKAVSFKGTPQASATVTKEMTSGICFAFETSKSEDTYWTDDELKKYYRLFIGYGTGSVLFSNAIESYQNLVSRGATISNISDNTNVWMWIIKKAGELNES